MTSHKLIIIAAALLMATVGCKKDFLEEKQDLGGVNEQVFQDSMLAQAYVDFVYGLFEAPSNASALSWNIATNDTKFSQTTEEMPGETNWNKVWTSVSYLNAHALDYFGVPLPTSIKNNTWTRLKQINLFLDNIDKYGLPEDTRARLKGQLYFWRGWQYFDLVRLYGGVPLVLHAQDPVKADQNEDLKVPRSPSSACIDQICADLDSAVSMLPGKWNTPGNVDWGRITSGAAAALKGRVLLTWASPLFNRGDDVSRWQRAYDANKAAKTILEANGFGLYKTGTFTDGTAFENMFTTEVNNPEAVIVFGFNNVISDQVQKYNGWEQAARPKTINGGGSLSASKQMLDAFPMKDGKMPGVSSIAYDARKFYKNRDPRFAKTFAYNGCLWPYKENSAYRLWTYRWYNDAAATTPANTTESKGTNGTSIYVRKGTSANASNASNGNFTISGTDYIELRFAEVLLNLAESAVGIGSISEGIDQLKAIRERAGITNGDGAYGLAGVSGRDAAFAAVLNERKIELAYEGKRFWDLRRWMLFNNHFGTCSRLGVTPLDGTRRTGVTVYVKNFDAARYNGKSTVDPLYKAQNTGNPLIEREPTSFPSGVTTQDQMVDYLYDHYFEIIEKDDAESTTTGWKFTWYDQYYFFGLNQNILNNSTFLEQTQGWDGLNGNGTFDPLK